MNIPRSISYLLLSTTLLGAECIMAAKTLAQSIKTDSIVPSQKDSLPLMQSICGANNIVSSKGQVSCKTCPTFTGTSGSSGGSLGAVTYGNFTKSDAREAFVDFVDCEAHAGNWGGSVLLRKTSQGWSRVRYEGGLRSNECFKTTMNTGRNSLVCLAGYTGMGYSYTWINTLEINPTKTKTKELLKVVSNTGSCLPPFKNVEIVNFKLQDVNNDGRKDLAVRVSEAREAKGTSKPNDRRCEPRLPKASLHNLTFLFDGQSFSPTAETAKLKKRLESDN